MGIKITPADSAFSKCVRLRVNYVCERCGAHHDKSSTGLHCSHHHRRGHWGVRLDPDNAESLCYGCHSLMGGTQERLNAVMTEARQELLIERKNDIGLGKLYRKTNGKGDIAKHYRLELVRIQKLRDEGEMGRIDFEGFY